MIQCVGMFIFGHLSDSNYNGYFCYNNRSSGFTEVKMKYFFISIIIINNKLTNTENNNVDCLSWNNGRQCNEPIRLQCHMENRKKRKSQTTTKKKMVS